MDNPEHLIDINVCHYSKQPHCCHIGYACAGPCHEAFVFCNITIPCISGVQVPCLLVRVP